jgi:hypothetical protein
MFWGEHFPKYIELIKSIYRLKSDRGLSNKNLEKLFRKNVDQGKSIYRFKSGRCLTNNNLKWINYFPRAARMRCDSS